MSAKRKRPRKLVIYETSTGELIVTASHKRVYNRHTLEEEQNIDVVYSAEQRRLTLSPREKVLYENGYPQNHEISGQHSIKVKDYKEVLEERRRHISEYWKRHALITDRLAPYVGKEIPKEKLRNRDRALKLLEQAPRPSLLDLIRKHSLLDLIKRHNNP